MPKAKTKKTEGTYFDRLEEDIKSNQNTLSLVLGALIVVVVGILLFNYFNRSKEPEITEQAGQTQQGDVSPDSLPGKYTIKEGDTLYTIAENYYKDGFKFDQIAQANNLTDVNNIVTGQEITIPKIDGEIASSPETTETPAASATAAPEATPLAEATPNTQPVQGGIGGADTTIWGPKITSDTYTVAEGDWLSTISARAYGDISSYQKIAQANNIADPNLIVPGTVLKLPR